MKSSLEWIKEAEQGLEIDTDSSLERAAIQAMLAVATALLELKALFAQNDISRYKKIPLYMSDPPATMQKAGDVE